MEIFNLTIKKLPFVLVTIQQTFEIFTIIVIKKRIVPCNQVINCFGWFPTSLFRQELEQFTLIARPEYEAEHNEKDDEDPWEIINRDLNHT